MGDSRIGEVLAGKYRLEAELGRGGMGAVYRAFHTGVHRTFAVKVLSAELAEKKAIAERFLREAQAAGRIGHSAILEVYDVGEDRAGRPFMVMELLDGESLAEHLARGPMSIDAATWVSWKLLDALSAAHGAGVVHRDVKPQNVFLVGRAAGSRTVKLLDFGIAKFLEGEGASITRSGEIIGSPLYMAPEQALGESDVDARADVWSVGACLFQMLTGRAAHEASSAVGVLARILTEPAPAPSTRQGDVPSELDAIVLRALSIKRDARWATAREMREALETFRASSGFGREPTFSALAPRPTVVVGRAEEGLEDAATDAASSTATSEGALRASDVGGTSNASASSLDAAVADEISRRRSQAGDATTGRRTRPVLAVAAIALLAGVAVTPWLVPEWRGSATSSAASGSANATGSPSGIPTASADASAEASAPDAGEAAALLVAARPDAGRAAVTAPPSVRPACAANEVASEGHCCPKGMVWQAGRCERPLATSF